MICQRCLRLGLRPSTRPIYQSTRLSTSGAGSAEPPTTPAAQSPPPATSTAAAQPFSTPHQQSPSSASGIPKAPSDPIAGPGRTNRDESARAKAAPAVVSSVPAGTPLKGLNYFKNKEDPIALEDHEVCPPRSSHPLHLPLHTHALLTHPVPPLALDPPPTLHPQNQR